MHTVVQETKALSKPNGKFLTKKDPSGEDVGAGEVESNSSPNKYL